MTRWWMASGVLLVAGCGGWFGDEPCEEGAERCDGKKILTCTPEFGTGSTSPSYSWKRSGSCAVSGGGSTCYEDDGLAFCGPEGMLDAGTVQADGPVDQGFASPFTQPSVQLPSERWMRVDVARAGANVTLTRASEAMLTSAPAAPSAGQYAAVTYDSAGRPLSAVLAALPPATHATAVWLKADGATVVRLLEPGGATSAELALEPATPKAVAGGALGQVSQRLGTELPPTLAVAPAGKVVSVPFPALSDGADVPQIPLTAVDPSPEQLAILSAGLRRLSPYAASLVAEVAFTDRVSPFAPMQAPVDAGPREIDLAEDAGLEIGELDAGAGERSASTVFAEALGMRRVAIVGATLIVSVEEWALASYQEDPLGFALELAREFSLSLVRLTSHETGSVGLGLAPKQNYAFPKDFPPDIEALIRERVSPLIGTDETLSGVWSAFHGLAVEGGLASPYLELATPTDTEAVIKGFASAWGAKSSERDFAEYVARASVPETWTFGPCSTIRSLPIDELESRVLVHVAKLEALWGLGLLTSQQVASCVGPLGLSQGSEGIVAHKPSGERERFEQNVGATVERYMHGQTQVALSGDQPVADGGVDEAVTATFALSTRGVPAGVMRLTAIGDRSDPEIGAAFYLSNSLRYTRAEATAGLLLITRVDEHRIEAHALMVRQGAKTPFYASPVFPLITARYDVPEDERAAFEER